MGRLPGVVVLIADLAFGLDPLGPRDDHGITRSPGELAVALEHLERGGEGHRPAGRVVVVGVRAAQGVEVLHVLRQFVGVAVEELVLVDRPVGRALPGGAVVGAVEHDGVLQLPGLLQVVDDPADLGVGVLRKAGVHLGHLREQFLLLGAERIPRPHIVIGHRNVLGQRVDRGHLGARGHYALFDHPRQHPLPVGLVAIIELALVFVDVILRSMMRRVVGTRAEPHEPRLGRVRRLLVAQHPDRVVGQILRQVIALVRAIGLLDESVVLDQIGEPLIGLPAQEPVEPVEAHLQRPLRFAAAAGDILLGNVVILADPESAVAVVLEHSRNRGALRRQPGRRTREPGRGLGDGREPVDVVVASGQKAGPRR